MTEATAITSKESSADFSAAPSSVPALEIRVARTIAEVEAIRGIWSTWNFSRDTDLDFCLQFVWSLKGFERPHVLVLYRDGNPEAMLLGRIDRVKMAPKLGYLQLPGMWARLLTFPSDGFLGNASPDNSEAFVRSILGALKNGEADAALLQQVDVDSPILKNALRLPRAACRDHVLKPMPHSVLNLSKNAEEVWLGLSSGSRADVRRKKRKLVREFGSEVRIQCFREFPELESAIPQVETIAKKTYQRAIGVGFRDSEPIRKRLRFLAERGWLRMYLLTLRDEPAAFWIGSVYNGNFFSDDLGFDPKFGEHSPGTFLLGEVIDDLCSSGVRKLNFGAGEGRYKERFSNCHWTEASVFIFSPKPRGIALNAIRTVVGLIENAMRRVLARSKLLPTIKKMWRSRLSDPKDSVVKSADNQ
jgi:Acetyltransferase (GNAT) domain